MVQSGHHILLRLLSLHLCNEYPSLPKKKKKEKVAKDIVANPAARHKSSLSGVDNMLKGRPEPGGECLGQQLVVAVEEGDGAVAVQRAEGFFFFFLGGKDIHYTGVTITTSRVCDVQPRGLRVAVRWS